MSIAHGNVPGDRADVAPRRVAIRLMLWAGPLGLGLAAVLLALAAPWFGHGPGVPTAGDPRAWGAMWAALGLVALGCALGMIGNLVWLAAAWRSGRRPSRLEWARAIISLLLGLGFALVYWSP